MMAAGRVSDWATSQSLHSRVAGYAGSALGEALNSLTSAGFKVAISENDDSHEPQDALIWRQPFSLADGAVFWLVAGKDLWNAVGQMILGGAGIESANDDDCRSTWNEIAGQTMSGIAQAMASDLGHEVLAPGGEQDAGLPGDGVQGAVLEVCDSIQVWQVRILWTSQFAETFSRRLLQSGPASSSANAVPASQTPASKTLDLLLDVALPVSVSFGKTSLQIREVLKLNTGSVVELDRLVSEPVEVIVNNCVIARGEVVVVDGNYGVRVIHLASRAERLRSGMSEASSRTGMAVK
jgi:flagellar motor switch protein FliN/FliY